MRMTKVFSMIASTVLAAQLGCVHLLAQTPPGNGTNVAVAPQYDTTHVYVAPEDFDRFVVSLIATFGGTTTKQGVFSSADGGGSWRQRDATPATQLAWGRPDALYRADTGGAIKVSADGGATWKDAGTVGMEVNELAVDTGGALYASVPGGEVRRSTDGGAHWSRLVKLK